MDTPTTSATPPTEYLVLRRDEDGPVEDGQRHAYVNVHAAKRSAIVRNTGRLNPNRWWVVADAAGTPLDPQP